MARTEALTSPANPLLKDVRRAISRGGLTAQGLMVAESFHLLDEALRSGLRIDTILVAESARDHLPRHGAARLAIVESAIFQKLAATETSQGVIALIEPPSWTFEQILGDTPTIVLDGVQDPGNAGAIVRAAEAFGASGVVFGKGSASPFHPKTLRASAGSLFRIPFIHGVGAVEARAELDRRGYRIFSSGARGAKSPAEANLAGACALVIGSEAHGVGPAWLRGAIGISIPTSGVESLNAAVAAGILLYEARRQRTTS